MAKLTDIVNKFDTARKTVATLKSFHFESQDIFNADKEVAYMALLFKPPVGRNAANDLSNKDWSIDFFVFDTWENTTDDQRSLAQVWEATEDAGRAVIRKVLEDRQNYGMVNPSTEPIVTYGYPMGNDRAVGTRFQFTLRAYYDCV